MQPELANAWGEFLSRFPWDWFLTLTFAEPVGSFRAHRLFGKFAVDIEKAAGRPIGWFRGDEYGVARRAFPHACTDAQYSRSGPHAVAE